MDDNQSLKEIQWIASDEIQGRRRSQSRRTKVTASPGDDENKEDYPDNRSVGVACSITIPKPSLNEKGEGIPQLDTNDENNPTNILWAELASLVPANKDNRHVLRMKGSEVEEQQMTQNRLVSVKYLVQTMLQKLLELHVKQQLCPQLLLNIHCNKVIV